MAAQLVWSFFLKLEIKKPYINYAEAVIKVMAAADEVYLLLFFIKS